METKKKKKIKKRKKKACLEEVLKNMKPVNDQRKKKNRTKEIKLMK
jgi:hypothetical protein